MTRRAAPKLAIVLAVVLAPSSASAQPSAEARAEARARFERGLELFEEQRYDAALAELSRAYELAPNWRVLFNIARSHAFLGRAVEAVAWYERFLSEGGAAIPRDMRRAAEDDLERQRARIAQLDVRCDVAGAVVSLDGVDVATTPLAEPLAVSAGEHVVAVRAAGYDQTSRAVQIAGRTRTELAFELRPVARGILRIRSPLPGVEVHVDDRVVGSTPLATTVPVAPGSHVVVGRRAGYRDARVEVTVDMAAEREVSLEPELDPSSVGELATLRLRIPHAPARARVDGREHDPTRPLDLPFGPHAVEVEVQGREPWRGTAQLEPGSELLLRVDLRWSEDARRERLDAASMQRATGWVLTGAGGALAIASAVALGWNESRVAAATSEHSTLVRCFEDSMGDAARRDQLCPPSYDQRADANDALLSEIDLLRGVFGATVGVAALAAVAGLVLALTAPDEDDIDRAASAELRVGPGSAALRVTF